MLDAAEFNQLVVYVSSNARARALAQLMEGWCFPCICVTSAMPVAERMRHFIAFKERKAPILVTTDLFGRGIDVERVNMVVNYDFPAGSDAYLHRVGRAGRFGTNGMKVSFVSSPEDEKVLQEVESRFEAKMHELKEPITKESWNVEWGVCWWTCVEWCGVVWCIQWCGVVWCIQWCGVVWWSIQRSGDVVYSKVW